MRDFALLKPGCVADISLVPPPGTTAGGAATTTTAGGATTSPSTTAGTTTTSTTTAAGGSSTTTTTTTTTTGGTTTGWPACPPLNTDPVPCYDPDSGFPELADYWVWETNPYRCDAACNCSVRTTYPLDPMDSTKVLMMPETSTTYRLAYYDGRDRGGAMNFVIRCTRQADGSIFIQAETAASFSFYTIFTCNASQGGQPVGTLYRVNDTQGHGCMVNQTAIANGTIPGMTCVP